MRLLREAGKNVDHIEFTLGEDIPDCDMIFFNAGSEKAMFAALADLNSKRERMQSLLQSGTKVLATGNSMALFGSHIMNLQSERIAALDFTDYACKIIEKRIYSEQIITFNPIPIEVIGVINTSLEVFISSPAPIFTATEGKPEGYASGNLFATQQLGPLLVKNPPLLSYFAELITDEPVKHSAHSWQNHAQAAHENIFDILKQKNTP